MNTEITTQKAIGMIKAAGLPLHTFNKGIRSAIGQTSSSQRYRTKGQSWTTGLRVRKSYVRTNTIDIDLIFDGFKDDFITTSERKEILEAVKTLFADCNVHIYQSTFRVDEVA